LAVLEQTSGHHLTVFDVQVQFIAVFTDGEYVSCVLTMTLSGAYTTAVNEEALSRAQPGVPQGDDVLAVLEDKPGFTSIEAGLLRDVDHAVMSAKAPVSWGAYFEITQA
jgi:hypothetical protein